MRHLYKLLIIIVLTLKGNTHLNCTLLGQYISMALCNDSKAPVCLVLQMYITHVSNTLSIILYESYHCTCTVYMYIHVCTCTYMYIHCKYTCMYMYIHCKYTCMYMHVHVHTCTYIVSIHVCTCTYIVSIHVCTIVITCMYNFNYITCT